MSIGFQKLTLAKTPTLRHLQNWRNFAPVFAGTAFVLLLPRPAIAEVMDKEPTLLTIWAFAFPIGLLGLIGGCRSRILGLLLFAVGGVLSLGMLSEIYDPQVGPAIFKEAGWAYVIQAHVASGLSVLGPLAGIFLFAQHTRNPEAAPE